MITLKIWIFNPFQENTFLAYDETGEALIIDAGNHSPEENDRITRFISQNKLKPILLVSTHGHVDHVLGNRFLKAHYNIPYAAHAGDTDLIADAASHALMFGFHAEEPPLPDHYLEEGEKISFGHSSLTVIHLPGHSRGGVGLYSPEQSFVIVGDTLFEQSIGRTDLPGGNHDQLLESIHTRLLALPDDTDVYPGHGPATTIGAERRNNPYLQ